VKCFQEKFIFLIDPPRLCKHFDLGGCSLMLCFSFKLYLYSLNINTYMEILRNTLIVQKRQNKEQDILEIDTQS